MSYNIDMPTAEIIRTGLYVIPAGTRIIVALRTVAVGVSAGEDILVVRLKGKQYNHRSYFQSEVPFLALQLTTDHSWNLPAGTDIGVPSEIARRLKVAKIPSLIP